MGLLHAYFTQFIPKPFPGMESPEQLNRSVELGYLDGVQFAWPLELPIIGDPRKRAVDLRSTQDPGEDFIPSQAFLNVYYDELRTVETGFKINPDEDSISGVAIYDDSICIAGMRGITVRDANGFPHEVSAVMSRGELLLKGKDPESFNNVIAILATVLSESLSIEIARMTNAPLLTNS